jgi:kynurenine formamidase
MCLRTYALLGWFLALTACASRPPFDESKVVDLTYAFNSSTVYWPTAQSFDLTRAAHGLNAAGEWYASNDFCASEHGGTHIDAPVHFAKGGQTTAQIELSRLIGPARVIDIRERCSEDPDYLLTPADIRAHEELHGAIEPGTIVLVHTGWGQFYPDAMKYLGSDVRGVAEDLHFPAIGKEAARYLVEKEVDLVGLDTASLDHGPSKHFRAHRVFAEANIPGLENVANLDQLPPKGATVIALPMKIEDGTGGPCRIVAILP